MADQVVPVFGFQIKKIMVLPGGAGDEEDVGKMQIILEAPKEELRAQDYDINDMLGAMNMHHSTREPVAVQLRF